MKIQVGVSSLDEARYFLVNGADEVYGGLVSIANHRTAPMSFPGLGDMLQAIELAHSLGKRFFFLANEVYQKTQYPHVLRTIQTLIEKGIDGIIIKDLFLLARLRAAGLETRLILTSVGCCFNSETLGFYRRQYNISRLILPQHLLPREAIKLVQNEWAVETEVFFLPHCCCTNLDGRCFLHAPYLASGTDSFKTSLPCFTEFSDGSGGTCMMPKLSQHSRLNFCYEFYELGVPYLKIARQEAFLGTNRRDFRAALSLLQMLKNKPGREAFVREGLKFYPK